MSSVGVQRSLFARIADRFGARLVANWRMRNLALAEHLHQLFTKYRIDTVLDIGANAGQYRDFLRYEVGFHGVIVSFEPIPEIADRLAIKSRDDDRWRILPVALSDADSEELFNISRDTKFSSFSVPSTNHLKDFEKRQAVLRTVKVKVRRLDSIIGDVLQADLSTRMYLKLDTQGHDLHVLKGSLNTIPRIVAMQSELSFIPIYEKMPDFQEALREYDKFGFTPSGIYPVSLDRAMRLIEADCILINSMHLENRETA